MVNKHIEIAMKKRVLIIGVGGFVGSSVAESLLQKNYEVIGVDNFQFGYFDRIKDFVGQIELKQTDFNLMRFDKIENIDLIINCAAIAPLPENQKDHFESIKTNVAMCGSVIDFACINGIKKIIHFSSSAVYENGISKNGIEANINDDLCPRLMYPVSKYLSEVYFESQADLFDIDITSIRLFNLYGPKQDYFRKQPPLLGYLIKNLIEKKEVTIYASGKAKRDYVYIDDLVEFIQLVALKKVNPGQKIVNIGSGKAYSVPEIITTLEKVSGMKIKYKKGDTKSFWGSYSELFKKDIPLNEKTLFDEINKMSLSNITTTYEEYGWEPKYNLEQGLNECMEYARSIL